MKTIPSLSVDSQVIVKRLEKASEGDVIKYAELSDLVKRDIQNGDRYVLESARRVIQREKGFVFEPVRGLGLKRLANEEIPSTGTAAIKAINRKSRRAAKTVAVADYDKLSREGKARFNTHLSILGAITQATRNKTVEEIESKVTETQERLALATTFDLFKK